MADAIKIREARKNDIPLIADILNSMYRLQRPRPYYAWQFFENPNSSILICGFKGRELIGTFGIQKRRLSSGMTCGQLSWLNIAPQWQGKGWFRKLGETALNRCSGLDILCVFANAKAMIASQQAFGFKTAGEIKTFTFTDFARIDSEQVRYERVTAGTRFPKIETKNDKTITFLQTPRFLRWRFAGNPMYKYDIVNNSGGYAVLKLFTDPETSMRYGDIVDLECDLNGSVPASALLRDACRLFKKRKIQVVTTWSVNSGGLTRVLNKNGFEAKGSGTYFMVKPLIKSDERLYHLNNWHLRQSDATNY